jgi:ferrous iron transport protein B
MTALILGLPNSGKSQLYNEITGDYTLVSNYPMTTVEPRSRERRIGDAAWEIVDTPGLHGLFIQSEEESVVRAEIWDRKPDLLIQCVDTGRLKQSLALTADLAELGVPLIIYLNAIGESTKKKAKIDAKKLSRALGVPVVESRGLGTGQEAVIAAMPSARVPAGAPSYAGGLDSAAHRIALLLPPGTAYAEKTALLLLENDRSLLDGDGIPASVTEALEIEWRNLNGNPSHIIAEGKERWLTVISDAATPAAPSAPRRFSEEFARLCRHPVFGLPILAVFLGILYAAVVYGAGFLGGLLTSAVSDPLTAFSARLLPDGFWEDLLVGPYGLLTLGLFNAVFTVLPILSVFFLVFGALEDIGYLPNLTILMRRLLGWIGITGNSIIPLVLGFGCKTMATMTARSLTSRKEKIIVIFLIAFAIPCSAQMGLNMAILGRYGPQHFLVTVLILAIVEVAAGFVLNAILPPEPASQFIQELPSIRLPQMGALLKKTGHRLVWFLKEAIPIFLIASVVLFILDKTGALGAFKRLISPLITGWLGLPLDMADALMLTMARHEAAAGMILRMSKGGLLDGVQSIIAVSITTMFVPCIANIVAMVKELGVKTGLAVALSINVSSFALAGAALRLLRLLQGGLGL